MEMTIDIKVNRSAIRCLAHRANMNEKPLIHIILFYFNFINLSGSSNARKWAYVSTN